MKNLMRSNISILLLIAISLFFSCGDENELKEVPEHQGLVDEWEVISYNIDIVSDKPEADNILIGWFSSISDENAIYEFAEDKSMQVDYSHTENEYFTGIATGRYQLYSNNRMMLDIPGNDLHKVFSLIICNLSIQGDLMTITWDYKYNFNNNQGYYLYPYFGIKDTTFNSAKIVKTFRKTSAG